MNAPSAIKNKKVSQISAFKLTILLKLPKKITAKNKESPFPKTKS